MFIIQDDEFESDPVRDIPDCFFQTLSKSDSDDVIARQTNNDVIDKLINGNNYLRGYYNSIGLIDKLFETAIINVNSTQLN